MRKIRRQLEQHISDLVLSKWLDGYGNVRVKLVSDPHLTGATDAMHYKVIAQLTLVLKYHQQDARLEKAGYQVLKRLSERFARKHLIRPLFGNEVDSAVFLVPYLTAASLHEIISGEMASRRWIVEELYADFLQELNKSWERTLSSNRPNLRAIYLGRIVGCATALATKWGLKDIERTQFILNDKKIGQFRDIRNAVENRLTGIEDGVKYSCTTHGDEHAKNILVKKQDVGIQRDSWVLIDCVKASDNSDWMFSIAKMLHWWEVYFGIEESKDKKPLPTFGDYSVDTKKNSIRVWYEAESFRNTIPAICQELSKSIHRLCENVGSTLFKEEPDVQQERLLIAVFSILFGSLSRHLDADNKFALPVLLGESLLRLAQLTER